MGEAAATRDPYAVLGLPAGAPHVAVRKAYRCLLRSVHPRASRGDDTAVARLHEVMAAYDVLERRARERTQPERPATTSGLLIDVFA